MKKIFLIFLLSIFLINFSSAVIICIDHTPPSAPSNLAVSGKVGNILLTWDKATDEPTCSGIEEYVISREGVEIGRVGGDVLNFTDSNESLGAGEYTYTVYAVDMVGHNTGSAIANEIEIDKGGSVRGGSYIGGYVCVENWTCEEWTECVGNEQRRLCSDLNECGTQKNKPETYQECDLMSQGGELTFEDDDSEVGGIDGFFSAIIGAVIGGGATSVAIAGGFLILIIGGFAIVIWKKK